MLERAYAHTPKQWQYVNRLDNLLGVAELATRENNCYMAHCEVQGRLVKLSRHGGQARPKRYSIRGQITEFSYKSRARLMQAFARIELPDKSTFITLTYPNIPTTERAKRDLEVFWKRLRYKYGEEMSAVWRLEFQIRGAAHYHMIVFNAPFIPFADLRVMWSEIIGQERPRVRIERLNSARGAMYYCSKYVAKLPDDSESSGFPCLSAIFRENGFLGRQWGILARKSIPWGKAFIGVFPAYSAPMMRFRLACSEIYPPLYDPDRPYGFFLMTDHAESIMKLFIFLTKDPFA